MKIICGIFLFIFMDIVTPKILPDYINRCKLNAPNLGKCLTEEIRRHIPRHAKGLPELDIPPFDPMAIPLIEMEQGEGTSLTFKATFRDIILHGIKDMIVHSIGYEAKKVQFDLNITFPKIFVEADYVSEGKLLLIPFRGEGRFNGTYNDLNCGVIMNGHYEMRDGKRYGILDKKTITLKIGESKMYFDNLFKDNQELTENTNRLINENSKEITEEVKPVLEEATGGVAFGLVKQLLDKFTMDELFIVD